MDIANKRIISIFEGHQREVSALDFSCDSRFIISGSWDNTVRIWAIEAGQNKTLSIMESDSVRVLVTYFDIWHTDAYRCIYGRF